MRHIFTNVAMCDNMHKGSYNNKILMVNKISKLCNKRYYSSCRFFEESTLLRCCALKLSRWEYILNDLVWGYVPREGTTSYTQQCALIEETTKGIISFIAKFWDFAYHKNFIVIWTFVHIIIKDNICKKCLITR